MLTLKRSDYHHAVRAIYGPMRYGYITRPMGHFIEQEPGGTGLEWNVGSPVEWYVDERGEEWPQVILPDGHVFTVSEDDLRVITAEKFYERVARLDEYAIRHKEV